MNFQVVSDYQPKGDQPQAIEKLVQGIIDGDKFQTNIYGGQCDSGSAKTHIGFGTQQNFGSAIVLGIQAIFSE